MSLRSSSRRRDVVRVMASLLALALIVVACGQDDSAEPTAAADALVETGTELGLAELALIVEDGITPISFDEFYSRDATRETLLLSDKLQALDGRKVVMQGYMAPPLQLELDFFVLTRVRHDYCPFCTSAAEWPDDIAVVYTPSPMRATDRPVVVEGTIETGSKLDPQTGMFSLVRIYADRIGKL